VRFLKTGGDANDACVRLARAVTGRDMVVVTAYHGWQDAFALPQHAGVPEAVRALTVRCPFGDGDAVAEAFRRYPSRIAAVLTVPYDWVADAEASGRYLRNLRELTRREGAMLIFDEVLTGFRLSLGGGQQYFGVMPDLATFAKAMANGFPLAAFVGSEAIMEGGLSQTIVSTTYAGDTLSLAAALATLEVMETEPVLKHLWKQGQTLMDGMDAIFRERGIPAVQAGLPPRFTTMFRTGDAANDLRLMQAFAGGLYRRGVFYRQAWNLSYSHGDQDLEQALEATSNVVRELKV
jgi:glutamate-1-semialdehyde aminotransferase